MVGWLDRAEKWRPWPRLTAAGPLGFPLLKAALPPGRPERRLRQGARALRRRGVSRVLAAPGLADAELLEGWGLRLVEPLALYRAMGGQMALFLLEDMPLRERRVALRGEEADVWAWTLAQTLCPQVGTLFLDFDRGEEELGARLRARYGAAPIHLERGPEPQVTLELSPRPTALGKTLRLWGEPELEGLTVTLPGAALPQGLPELPFLELLWETGRVKVGELAVIPVNRP